MKNNSIIRSISLFAAALGLSLSTSQAANVTKSDTTTMNGGGLDWSTAPATTDVGEFTATPTAAHLAAMTLGGTMTLGGLQLDGTMAGPLTIASTGGFYFTNGASGINMSAANQSLTFNNLLALSANQTWLVGSAQTLTVNGVVSGPGALVIGDGTPGNSGTVVFGGQANVFPNGALINGGIVKMGAVGSLGGGSITNNGAILVLPSGGASPANNLVFSNTSVVDMNYYAGNENLSGSWSGNGTVTVSNLQSFAATFTVGGGTSTGLGSFSGKIIVAPVSGTGGPAEGTVRFNSGGSNYNVGSTAMSIDLGAAPSAVTLIARNSPVTTSLGELKGGPNTSLIGSRSSNGVDTWSIGGLNTSTTFAGTITNSYGGNSTSGTINSGGVLAITKVGSGTLTLTGTNYYTGNTTFSGGYLKAGSPEATAGYANPLFGWGAPDYYGGPFGVPTNASALVQSAFIFNGGTLQYSAANQYDYSPRFSTAGSQSISVDVNGQNVTFATAITGTGTSLTNMDTAGGGSLTLTAAETYTGPTVVASGGRLVLSGSGALNSGTTLAIQPGGTFDVSALSSSYTVAVTVAGSGTGTSSSTAATIKPASGGIFDFNTQPITVTWGGALSGTDSTHPVLKASQGTLNFNGNTIDVIVPGGGLNFLGVGTYTLITAPAITGTPASTPSYAGGNGLTFGTTGTISVVGGNTVVLTVAQDPITTWTDGNSDQLWSTSGNWSPATPPNAAGALVNFGTAVNPAITLNVNATFGGAVFTNAHSYTISGANTITIDNSGNGATLEVGGGTANQIASAVSLNDNLTTLVFANQSLNLSGVVANTAGAKTLTLTGAGTNILGNANTYGPAAGSTGTTLSGGGTLRVGNSSALGAGDLAVTGGADTLQSGAAGLTLANNIGIASGLTLTADNNGNILTLGGLISGSGGLKSIGSGTNVLTGSDTFTGALAVNAGTLLLTGSEPFTGAIAINAGTLKIADPGVLDGAGVVAGGGTNSANIADATLLDYASSQNQVLTGVISGAGGLQMDGPGVLALQGANTFTGNVVINGGIVSVQNINNNTLATSSSLGNPQTAKTITVNNNGILSMDNGNSFGGGSTTDNLNFIINSGGLMRITNSNDTIGPVTINGGTIDATGAASISAQYGSFEFVNGVLAGGTGTSTINNTVGGYYNLTVNTNNSYGTISVTNSAAVLNINAMLANSGGIATPSSGVAGLVKVGAGTLNLSAANVYLGNTTISNGTLALVSGGTIATSPNIIVLTNGTLDYSAASSKTLAASQTLSGTGIVKGLATTAGAISPGGTGPGGTGAAGTLTFSGGLGLSGSTALSMEFSRTNATGTNDLIVVNSGNLTVSGPITISMSFFGGTVSNGVYPVITYPVSGYSGTATQDFGGIIPGSAATLVATNILAASGSNVIAMIVAPPARPTTNLVWTGDYAGQWPGDSAGNTWSPLTTVSNWVAGAVSNSFQSADSVIFGDLSLANTLNTNVFMSGTLYPSAVVVSNSAGGNSPIYWLNNNSGGAISASATLIKTNSGTLILPSTGNYNKYTGPTVLGGGTVVLSEIENGGAPSPIGASSNSTNSLVFAGGTLYFGANQLTPTDRGATLKGSGANFAVADGGSLAFSGVFAGTGPLSMTDTDPLKSGTLTLSGANIYTGGTTNNAGTLVLGNAAGAGTGPITFNGGTMSISSGGTILNNIIATTNGGLLMGSQTYQLNGTIYIPTNGVLNISVIGGGLAGSTNTMTINSNFTATAGSVIRVKDNTYGFLRMLATSGTTNATIDLGNSYVMMHTKTPGNIIDIGGLMGQQGTSLGGSRSAAGATTWRIGANGSNTVFSGTMSNNLDSSNGTIGNPTVMNIIKVGTGMLTLTADETYNGVTTISNGVLQVENNGQYDSNLGLYGGIYGSTMTNGVYDGALSNCPVIISGGTLAGNGTIVSGISNQYGGKLQPGYGAITPATTILTVSNVTLLDGSSTIMQVKHLTSSDQLTVNGQIAYGGVLTVNKADSGYSVSDPPIQLFPVSGTGSYVPGSQFATIQPPPGPGLGWSGSTLTTDGSIHVVTATAPTAGFTGSPVSGAAPLTTTFVDSSANANYWVWNFGDGATLITGSNTNVPHVYANPGTYTVVESAFGTGGSNGLTRSSYVNVSFPTPVAAFTAGPGGITTNLAPMTVTFTNLSLNGTNFIWTFGNGNTIYTNSTANVTNIYATAGAYTVQLLATNPGNYAMAISNNYIVATNLLPPVPTASFTGGPTNVFVSQTVTLTDTSVDTGSGTITNVWNFGDTHYTTNVTADISVTHAYTNAGSKTVSLTVSGQGGSSTSTQTSYVVVSGVVQLGTATVSGGNIGFSGTGGPVGAQYRIKMTTDISQPLASWTVVKTATFGAGGSYSYSAPTGVGPAYYIMVSP